ncbi:MAG TPA: polymorphic toxin-type HINT domain-containing protein, partial [Acidimicrobiales bacterium]|nr:polymorphic toxin-type HINT domain-containing protein [Acidimicrobiales bacterium]
PKPCFGTSCFKTDWGTVALQAAMVLIQPIPGVDVVADAADAAEVVDAAATATDATASIADEGGSVADDLSAIPCAGQSFSAGSRVVLAGGGTLAISQLRPGAQVLATNPQTGKTQPETVQAVMVNHDTDLMNVVVDTPQGQATIDSTDHHLFWDLTTQAWTDADQLRSGDQLWTPDGQLATVVRTVTIPGAEDMWDLTVANDHDFYVVTVATAVLVHNCPLPSGPPTVGAAGEGPASQGLQNQIWDHLVKLNDYMQNPLDADNQGILANAINNGVGDADSIYYGRIDHLLQEIRAMNGQ